MSTVHYVLATAAILFLISVIYSLMPAGATWFGVFKAAADRDLAAYQRIRNRVRNGLIKDEFDEFLANLTQAEKAKASSSSSPPNPKA